MAAFAAVTVVAGLAWSSAITSPARPEPGPTAVATGRLSSFSGCEDVAGWYRPMLERHVSSAGLSVPASPGGGARLIRGLSQPERRSAVPEVAAAAKGAVGPGATGTNVQEAGVDEPDAMKSAGGRLVTTVGDRLEVFDVSGRTPVRTGAVTIPWMADRQGSPDREPALPSSGANTELLLVGDRVVLLSSSDYRVRPADATDPGGSGASSPAPGPSRPSSSGAPVLERYVPTVAIGVVDIAQSSRPVLVTQEEVEGTLVTAREIGGSVRVVISSVPNLGAERVRTVADLSNVGGEELLPHVITRSHSGEVARTAPAMSCHDLTHPEAASGPAVISVRTVDVAAAKPGSGPVVHATGVAADGDVVYASRDRLFAATTRGGWGMLEETPAQEDAAGVSTEVHAFDIGSPRQTRYLGSGRVSGYVLDRWAMSARDGMLRIATTRQPQPGLWSGRTDSAVSVLRETDGALTLVGEVTGLGKGERITSVRWFDDAALVVTFRQTDPLYVVDLSRPTDPQLRGELKVPGFSTYLHPIGEHRILGVGSAATDEGQVTGAQLSVFDISDPDAPRRQSVLIRSKASTPVQGDARLFSYSPSYRSAVLPLMSTTTGATTVEGFRVGVDGRVVPAGALGLGNPDRLVALDTGRIAVTSWQGSQRMLSLIEIDGLVPTGSTRLT